MTGNSAARPSSTAGDAAMLAPDPAGIEPAGTAPPKVAIELRDVSHWYGNVVAVNGITMSIGPGITGLLGPNGAGKSTILHMIAGFLAPSRGELTVAGRPPWRNPGVYASLGLVPERDCGYAALTGEQFVQAMARLHKLPGPDAAARRAIALTEMTAAASRKIATYSKGMRQRIKVAAALVHDPAILVLDEPFNGMDPRQRLHLIDLLGALGDEGRAIVFSSHILEEVERVAGTIQVMVAGRLAASGDIREIRRLMTSRPHVFSVRSSDDRSLAAALMARPDVAAVELTATGLSARTTDYGAFTSQIAVIACHEGITLRELLPADETLESVFGYLISD
jgi:ABC-2 type transport system ATP-binding protein